MGLESRVVICSASSSVSTGYPGVDRRAADSVWRSRADWLSCMVAEYGPRAHLVAAAPFASHFRSTESLTPAVDYLTHAGARSRRALGSGVGTSRSWIWRNRRAGSFAAACTWGARLRMPRSVPNSGTSAGDHASNIGMSGWDSAESTARE